MKALTILVWVCIAFLAALAGQLATGPAIGAWYVTLTRPAIAPPNWVFAPVWTILYIMMGIAAGLVWQLGAGKPAVRLAIGLFLVQLVLNALWSYLFFGWHLIGLAFIELIVLWLVILWTLIRFYALSPAAGLLLVPYLLWVSFAAVLNFYFWWLNK